MKIKRIGICGYGNLGRGIESEIVNFPDMALVGIFTRRDPQTLHPALSSVDVMSINVMKQYQGEIDVMIMAGGSRRDLPKQVPEAAKYFNTVDSFDTHKKIWPYFNAVDNEAENAKHTSIVSGGWDPGWDSVQRVVADAILPKGETNTFYGDGVSQGHSNAIRRIKGVKNAIQYTTPIEEPLKRSRDGEIMQLESTDMHIRRCFVVLEEGADKEEVYRKIVTMKNYFEGYKTEVSFITEEEMEKSHNRMYHAGDLIHNAITGNGNKQQIQYLLRQDSNPEFTASTLLALARACYRMNEAKQYGAKTLLHIPPMLLSARSEEELLKKFM